MRRLWLESSAYAIHTISELIDLGLRQLDVLASDGNSYVFGQARKCPLGRPLADPRFRQDLPPRAPLCAKNGNPGSVHDLPWPPEPFPLGPGIPEAGLHPFFDEAPLELGDGAEDGEHHLACQCAGVDLFRKRNKLYAEGFAQLGCYSAQRDPTPADSRSGRSRPSKAPQRATAGRNATLR